MTYRQLLLALVGPLLLVVVAVVTLWFAWTANAGVEYRKANQEAVEQRAKNIDHAAGMPSAAPNSALALARILGAGNEAETDYVKLLRSLGGFMLAIAAQQIGLIMWVRRGDRPSNPSFKRDALKRAP